MEKRVCVTINNRWWDDVMSNGMLFIGDGKTHYIEKALEQAPHSLKIAVNEAFTPLNAIKKLTSELPTDVAHCAVYFNFTMLPPGVSNLRPRHATHSLRVCEWVGA